MARVQAHQRLVQQQQTGLAHQRLRQHQPLPLAAGGFGQGAPGQGARAYQIQHTVHLRAARLPESGQAEPVAIDHAAHELRPTQPHAGDGGAGLRHVANRRVAAGSRLAQHAQTAACQRQQAEDGAHQRGLAGAVRSQHAHELPLGDRQADVGEDRAGAQHEAGAVQFDRGHGGGRARSTAFSSPNSHVW